MKSRKSTIGKESNSHPEGNEIVQDAAAQRQLIIATAAYYRAEKRCFTPGDELADWFEAEAEIEKHSGSSPT